MTRYAVFIGVGEYEHEGFTSFETIGRSARDLRDLFGKSPLWTDCLLVEPSTPQGLIDGLRPLVQDCGREDVLLVYFCGHGELVRRGDQYAELHLATGRSEPNDQVSQLPLHLVYDELRKAKVLVLDCCHCGEVPALSSQERESVDIRPDPTTSVLKALRGREPKAHAEREEGDYTAFSGALIDILSRGLPGAGDPLSINDVFQELVKSLRTDGRPVPDMISRGDIAPLPLFENVGVAESRIRDVLGKSDLPELARMWAGKSVEDVPVNVVAQHVRGRLLDGSAAVELPHQLHGQGEESSELLEDFLKMVLFGPDNLVMRTVRSLAGSECADCEEFCDQLLRRAVTVLTTELLVEMLLDQDLHLRAEVDIAAAAAAEKFAAVVKALRRNAGRRCSAVVDRLIELFVTRRKHSEVRELLTELRAHGRKFDADTVLIEVALSCSPTDAAAFVEQARGAAEHDGPEVSRLVVKHRRPREIADFIAGFEETAEPMMRSLLPIAAQELSADWMIRLTRALLANDLPDAPSAIVSAALHRGTPSAEVAELLDGLTDCDTDQSEKIDHVLSEHLAHSLTPVDELAVFLRRDRGPGRTEGLVREVVGRRDDINDLIELHRYACTENDDRLAAQLTWAVAEKRGALDLVDYVHDFEAEPVEELFRQVAELRDGDTMGHLLSIWEHPDQRPVALQRASDVLPDLVADHMPPTRLLAVRRYLDSVERGNVLDPVVRKVLANPHRLDPPVIAALLADLSKHSGRKTPEVVHEIPRELGKNLGERGDPPVGLDYLADVVAAVSQNGSVAPTFVRIVVEGINQAVDAKDETALSNRYLTALRASRADEWAEAFKRGFDP